MPQCVCHCAAGTSPLEITNLAMRATVLVYVLTLGTILPIVCLLISCAECTSFAQPHPFLCQATIHGRLPTKLKLRVLQLCTCSSCIALM